MTVALAITMLTGCGAAATNATQTAGVAAQALAKVDPFAALHNLQVKDMGPGGPGGWYNETDRHLEARTVHKSKIWVFLNNKSSEVTVLHNTQTVTNKKKLTTLANAMRTASKNLSVEERQYVAMLASRLDGSITSVR
jgi:hypothetical protein